MTGLIPCAARTQRRRRRAALRRHEEGNLTSHHPRRGTAACPPRRAAELECARGRHGARPPPPARPSSGDDLQGLLQRYEVRSPLPTARRPPTPPPPHPPRHRRAPAAGGEFTSYAGRAVPPPARAGPDAGAPPRRRGAFRSAFIGDRPAPAAWICAILPRLSCTTTAARRARPLRGPSARSLEAGCHWSATTRSWAGACGPAGSEATRPLKCSGSSATARRTVGAPPCCRCSGPSCRAGRGLTPVP